MSYWLIPILKTYWFVDFLFIDDGVVASESENYLWSSIGFSYLMNFLGPESPVLCLFSILRLRFVVLKKVFDNLFLFCFYCLFSFLSNVRYYFMFY